MTNAEKESLFYDFVKQHEQLEHLTFGEPIAEQQWIGVLKEGFKRNDGVVIDPNWDGIYEDYINSSGAWDESIEYITNKISSIDTNRKLADFITTYILEKLKVDNIQSEKVYVCISNHWNKTWFDSVEES
jgi:hypothetical protein